jgi:ADP-ribose pyrophosphatase
MERQFRYPLNKVILEIPAGKLDAPDEDRLSAIRRELREETGLTARQDSAHRAVIEYPISPVGRKQVVFFPGQVSGIPRVRPGENERFKWVTADELDAHLFPDTAAACRKLISGDK